MTTAPIQQLNQIATPALSVRPPAGRWIMNSWFDQLLIVSTPLLIIPIVYFIHSPLVGVDAETIGLIVTAFFALGHHLPGMMRAYGDRDLFQRFHLRFIFAPPLLFIVFFPLYRFHYDVWRLTTMFWATWHGLMQLYGFVRIYDAKTGSISRTTANLDWLMCLFWFSTITIFKQEKTSNLLENFYSMGGPLLPPLAIRSFQWICFAGSIVVLIAFLVNYIIRSRKGPRPNPIKLVMLASGIGFFGFAMMCVENPVLGVALFDISHDVQYLAIVWLYNCRRVVSNPSVGRFMKFVFRRGMSLLYVGVVVAYGAIGLVPSLIQDETVKTIFTGILWTSTILHYYYDGFIWKVRESSTQATLGLNEEKKRTQIPQFVSGGYGHLLKWSPLILLVGWYLITDLTDQSLSIKAKKDLKREYTQQLASSTKLPREIEAKSWLMTEFERVQNIAAAVPSDQYAQLRAAIMLANFGRNDEAIQRLDQQVKEHPGFSEGYTALGAIHLYRGNLDKASEYLQAALVHATTKHERSAANLKLGELCINQRDPASAKAKFADALKDNPELEAAVASVRKRNEMTNSSP